MASALQGISTKLGIDVTDFKTGIREANRELKLLESGFRAGVSAMGNWGSNATGLEARMGTLTQKIDIQKLKVSAMREEWQRLAQAHGQNSIEATNAEIRFNQEVEALGKMENELGNTESALQAMKSGSEQTGESVTQLGDKSEQAGSQVEHLKSVLNGVAAVAKAVVTAIVAIVGAVVAVAGALALLTFQSAAAADELAVLSVQSGMSVTTLQELGYAGDQLGFSLDTVTTSTARLTRSMDDAAKNAKGEMAGAFNELGVSVTDANGDLRSSEDVFMDVIDALGQVENPAERDALAMQILGKNARELNPLIAAGSDELARLSDEAHRTHAIVSEETIMSLEGLNDQLDGLKATAKAAGMNLAGALAPSFSKVVTALQDIATKGAPIVQYAIDNVIVPAVEWMTEKFLEFAGAIDWSSIINGVINFGKTWEKMMNGKFDLVQYLTDIDWGELSDKIIEILGKVDWNGIGKKIGEFLKGAFGVGKDVANEFDWGGVLDSLWNALVGIGSGISESFGGASDWDKMWSDLDEQLQASLNAYGPLKTVAKVIVEINAEIFPNALDPGQLKATLNEYLALAVQGIGLSFSASLYGQISLAISKLKERLKVIGKMIVEGIWAGILGAEAKFFADIVAFFTRLIQAAKDALGIQSPSREFAWIGEQTALGFGVGFDRQFARIEQQMASAFGGLSASPALAPASVSAATGGPSAGGTVIQNYFYGVNIAGAGRDTTIGDLLDKLNLG